MRPTFLILILFLCCERFSFADVARMIPSDTTHQISGLVFKNEEFNISKTNIEFHGEFRHSDWVLIWDNKRVSLSENGKFQLKVPILEESANVDFIAVSPLGEFETQRIRLYVPREFYSKVKRRKKAEEVRKTGGLQRAPIYTGLGVSIIRYEETNKSNFSGTALTVKAGYSNVLYAPYWTYGINTYFTAANLTKTGNAQVRFLGSNIRAGYTIPKIKEPWKLSVFGGWYYTTMFVSSNAFGFRNMAGPQLYPVVRYAFVSDTSMVAYFKYSPVAAASKFVSFKNHEIAFGGAYLMTLKNTHPLSLTLDVAFMHLDLPTTTTKRVVVDTNSISLGASYGL